MDKSSRLLRVSDDDRFGNSTEIFIEERDPVEPLSIIVWCVGGVLLITLLSLLGRIILAKKKHPFLTLDENGEPSARRNNVFRIQIGESSSTGYHNRMDPGFTDVVPEYTPTQRTSTHRAGNQTHHQSVSPHAGDQTLHHSVSPQAGDQTPHHSVYTQAGHQVYHVRMERAGNQQHSTGSNSNSSTDTESSAESSANQCSYSNTVPQFNTRHCRPLSPVPNGRIASINGYLVSPPPYQQVVSSDTRLPSVIVARQQRTPQRRLDFCL